MKRIGRMRRVRRLRRLQKTLGMLAIAGLLLSGQGIARAAEIDLLVDKLVEKDLLTRYEGQMIVDETRTEVARQNASGKNTSVPTWVQTMQFSGDLRLRYQKEEKETAGSATSARRERGRVRLRLGAQAKVNNELDVLFGFISGSADPRSGNQTLQDNFTSKAAFLDYMYAKQKAIDGVYVSAGKIKLSETLWLPTNLLWSGDINPEGVAVAATLPGAFSGVDLFLNAGWFLIDEVSAGVDPSLVYIQPGMAMELTSEITLKAAAHFYFFNALQGFGYANINNGGSTNTLTDGGFTHDYDSYGAGFELGYKPKANLPVKYLALYGDYITNPDPDDENTGYFVGLKFGDTRVRDPGTWQGAIQYRTLEKDAWVDFLPDSTLLDGGTDAKGTDFIFTYGLAKNVSLAIKYVTGETIKKAAKVEQNILQIDCSMRF